MLCHQTGLLKDRFCFEIQSNKCLFITLETHEAIKPDGRATWAPSTQSVFTDLWPRCRDPRAFCRCCAGAHGLLGRAARLYGTRALSRVSPKCQDGTEQGDPCPGREEVDARVWRWSRCREERAGGADVIGCFPVGEEWRPQRSPSLPNLFLASFRRATSSGFIHLRSREYPAEYQDTPEIMSGSFHACAFFLREVPHRHLTCKESMSPRGPERLLGARSPLCSL